MGRTDLSVTSSASLAGTLSFTVASINSLTREYCAFTRRPASSRPPVVMTYCRVVTPFCEAYASSCADSHCQKADGDITRTSRNGSRTNKS
jgi:hypothetical protein